MRLSPYEALAVKCPEEVYSASPRPYDGLPAIHYPLHEREVLVTACGRICMHRKKITVSTVLAGQRLGIKEVDDGIRIVSFMHGSGAGDGNRTHDIQLGKLSFYH